MATRAEDAMPPPLVGLSNNAANPLPISRYRETSAGAQPPVIVPYPSNGAAA